jgi:hypothetical protein
MNKIKLSCVAVALLVFASSALAGKVDESDKPPFIGMTKTQALARYGNPNHKTSTEQGETWMYILNMGQFVGKHMIPFFFSTQTLRTGVLIFNQAGRVKTFRWDTPED